MKLQAQVKFFRGVVKAEIQIAGVTLIAGHNGAGKSSLLQAIAAAAARAPVPFFKSEKPDSALVTKKDAKELVYDTSDIGGVRLSADDGAVQVGWPGLDVETKGDPPEISRVSAGIITPLDMQDKDRATFFAGLLQATPNTAELIEALTSKDIGLLPAHVPDENDIDPDTEKPRLDERDQPVIDEIVEKVDISGFDAAHDAIKTSGAKLKGRWEEVTDERFGVTKDTWTPKGWTEDLEDADPAALEEQLADARQAFQTASTQAAVDDAQLATLKENALKEQNAKVIYDDAVRACVAASTAKQECKRLLNDTPKPPTLVPCAHCGAMNKVTIGEGGKVSVAQSDLDDTAYKALQQAYSEASIEYQTACDLYGEASTTEGQALAQWNAHKGAQAKYQTALTRQKGADTSTASAAAGEKVQEIGRRLTMVTARRRAANLHSRVVLHNKILTVLAPTGLRQKKMTEALASFNSLLAGISTGAGFDPVVLHEDLSVTYGNRPYFLAADSQKWRSRVAVQIAAAIKEGAPLVIVDGADILDGVSREGFIQALIQLSQPEDKGGAELNALVAMTLPKPEIAPPLGKLKMGNTYWLSGGEITNSM